MNTMGKSKSPAPIPVPQPTVTPVAQKPAEPINRTAATAEAQDRVASNKSAELLAPGADDEQSRKATGQAGMMS